MKKRRKGDLAVPELPEMETYRRFCSSLLIGRTITHIEVTREKSINTSVEEFKREGLNRIVIRMDRHAKHLAFHLSSGKVLLLHLMLGGLMFFGSKEERPSRTVQITLSFGEMSLYFIGLRLGYLHLISQTQLAENVCHLGPEPLSDQFAAADWMARIQPKRGMLKHTLVDQKFISGIGNCYSDEICWQAGILPFRKCSELSDEERIKLFYAMRHTLEEAVKLGGYMEQPFTTQDNLTGGYNNALKVYDCEHRPCLRCGHLIQKDVDSSRKIFYCKGCQR